MITFRETKISISYFSGNKSTAYKRPIIWGLSFNVILDIPFDIVFETFVYTFIFIVRLGSEWC